MVEKTLQREAGRTIADAQEADSDVHVPRPRFGLHFEFSITASGLLSLGGVHRLVGVREQGFRVAAVAGETGDADAGIELDQAIGQRV